MRSLIAALVMCMACSAGPRAYRHPLALGAEGATVQIRLLQIVGEKDEHLISGELLSVTDSGLWLLTDHHVTWVAYGTVGHAEFDQTGDHDFWGPEAPSKEARERLRLESRFPQGISPDLMRKLMASYGDSVTGMVRFLDAARLATARYRDVSRAIADGYRPIGPDTPAMGQHWIQLGLLIGGKVDPQAPAILEYAGSAPMLVGVAYAVPLGPGEVPPDAPVSASGWHTHQGTLDDEGLNGRHAGMDMGRGDRVAVLHAWVWLPNPAGTFEAQNWLLPLATWVWGFADS